MTDERYRKAVEMMENEAKQIARNLRGGGHLIREEDELIARKLKPVEGDAYLVRLD